MSLYYPKHTLQKPQLYNVVLHTVNIYNSRGALMYMKDWKAILANDFIFTDCGWELPLRNLNIEKLKHFCLV